MKRRDFLSMGVKAAAVAGVATTLASCGGASTDPAGRSTTASVPPGETSAGSSSAGVLAGSPGSSGGTAVLPTFKAFEPVEPDLPRTGAGAAPAYFGYPKEPVRAHTSPPSSGGTVTAMNYAATVPPAMDNNTHWKELNQRLGATLKINYSPSDQYSAKVATTVAGGDLPDLMPLNPSDVAHLDELLEAKFQDLTPWLAGDAAAKYPSLAALPTVSWMNTIFNNRIYGIPYSIPLGNPLPSARQDVLDDLKVSAAELADGDDFQKLCEEVTDERASRWAFGVISDAQSMARIMADVPNQWRVVDGKFTAHYAVDEYKDSISYAQRLWKAGVLNPDAPTISYGQNSTLFIGGKVVIRMLGYITWPDITAMGRPQNPKFDLAGLVLPKISGGGQGTYPQSSGEGSRMTAMKKTSPDRVEELLRIHDWIASPFGTEEYLFVEYGSAGRDYRLDGTDPILTETGNNEVQRMLVDNFGRAFRPIYVPGDPDMAKREHKLMDDILKVSFPLPTVGLVSQTDLTKGAALKKILGQAETDIILGRKPLSAWDAAVKTWLSGGGTQIGHEYEDAYAKSGRG